MGNRRHLFGRLTGKLAIRDVPIAVNDRKPLAARHIHRNAKRTMTFHAPRGARHGARLVDHARHDHERLKIIKKARPDLIHIGADLGSRRQPSPRYRSSSARHAICGRKRPARPHRLVTHRSSPRHSQSRAPRTRRSPRRCAASAHRRAQHRAARRTDS